MATVERLKTDSKRAEIIKLRFAGHTLEQVGAVVGLTLQGVKYHEDAWLAEQKPSSEVTEHRRQMQLAAIDSVRTRLFAALDDDEGNPRPEIVDRIDKLWIREAKLVGLDLTVGVTVNVITRESLAEMIWVDEPVVIEGTAVEIEAGGEA